jgi:hypothetical protein
MAKIFSSKSFMMTVYVDVLLGMASTHFVIQFVAIKIHLCFPLEFGLIFPMKSNLHC